MGFGSARFRDLRATLPPVYWTVWVGTLINRAGAFVAPILTFYLTRHRGLSLGEAGSIVALFGAGTVVASLVGGALADRLGRKVTMVGSLFGGACAMLWVSASTSLGMLCASVLVLGFVGDLYRPAVHAFVADVVPPEHRQRAYGFLYWAINLGFSIAPVAAGFVATFSYRALFIGDAVTSALFSLVVLVRVPETHPDPTRQSSRAFSFSLLLRDHTFMWFWLIAMLQACIIFQLTVTLSGWMQLQGYGPGVYGAVLAINGMLIVLLQ
ncbi:MAG TPA: MFS transporter, partial [Kofleriaceae bacterium]|nr:MFS transporter [Kofleriaceae bacterium]